MIPENPDPLDDLYVPILGDDDANEVFTFSIAGSSHPNGGSGFRIDVATGVLRRGPVLSFEDGESAYVVLVAASESSPLAGTEGLTFRLFCCIVQPFAE